jgi:thymidylate synthase
LFGFVAPGTALVNQIDVLSKKLAETPFTRRAQAVTWKVWEDNSCYDPPCLQSIWCRITGDTGAQVLNMNVRFRSNDAYKAAFMNIFALVQLQSAIAGQVSDLTGKSIRVGRYCHIADSYHIYGSAMQEFEGRFLGALQKRSFEQRTLRHEDVYEMMEGARIRILEKASHMGR